jgi:hypothetical protein
MMIAQRVDAVMALLSDGLLAKGEGEPARSPFVG